MPLTSERPHSTARQREQRRLRIMDRVRSGISYEQIGHEEKLSRERVRQIVVQSLQGYGTGRLDDHNRVQLTRLEPALRLAARAVEEGDLRGVTALLRVLDRMDKYGAAVEATREDHAAIHKRLMAKLNIEIGKLDSVKDLEERTRASFPAPGEPDRIADDMEETDENDFDLESL